MSSATLQDHPSVDSFFNVAETETLALFEHLSFEFLEGFDVTSEIRAMTGVSFVDLFCSKRRFRDELPPMD